MRLVFHKSSLIDKCIIIDWEYSIPVKTQISSANMILLSAIRKIWIKTTKIALLKLAKGNYHHSFVLNNCIHSYLYNRFDQRETILIYYHPAERPRSRHSFCTEILAEKGAPSSSVFGICHVVRFHDGDSLRASRSKRIYTRRLCTGRRFLLLRIEWRWYNYFHLHGI